VPQPESKLLEAQISVARQAIPYLDQYFGVWAMEQSRFLASFEHVRRLNLTAHLASEQSHEVQAAAPGERFELEGGIAIVELRGTLMKHASSFDASTSTAVARRQIRAAARDERVTGILLVFDSPGGTVAGTKDLADDVAEARKRKPVYAFVEDLCASAAYWIASQAEKVFANATALVGSIGTYAVLEDLSGMAEQLGIKVHVVKAGEYKGAGVPGTEITEAHLAEAQRLVDELNGHFLKAVGSGRALAPAKVRELADGRVHVGKAAAELGLIDGVQTIDATIKQLSKSRKGNPMSQTIEVAELKTSDAVCPATFAELKAGCVGADPAFLCAQLEASATLPQAQAAWMREQATRLQASQQELADVKAAKPAAPAKPGVDPVTSKGGAAQSFEGDALSAWEQAIAAKVQAGLSKAKAISTVAHAQPELHAAYLAAFNAEHHRDGAFARSRFADAA
jgi:protease-4